MNKLITLLITLLFVSVPLCIAVESENKNMVKITSPATRDIQATSIDPAVVYPGLPAFLVTALAGLGYPVIIVGGGLILAGVGYMVYRKAATSWVYYKALGYNNMVQHAYDHINDFPNIWGARPPTRDQFKSKCQGVMNSKTKEHYIDITNMRQIAYDGTIEMMTVGETNGKDIVTCSRYKRSDVNNKIATKQWIPLKVK